MVHADIACSRAVVADEQTTTATTAATRGAAENALVTAERLRDEASLDMSIHSALYNTANALVAHAQATQARAEQERMKAAANREQAKALVEAAREARTKAAFVKQGIARTRSS
jgi:hypothetical protein